ncbi:uncharacterized protein LOC116615474 [Nematostella vectensis]|uniref:uncharacterized protein LOC116615474 n=1 Tax=Nematostella vectensis TaxID=45351 RepID=UPI002077722D|nr:uncharacterized protein LOC116615474 [Nematostella vectensis]
MLNIIYETNINFPPLNFHMTGRHPCLWCEIAAADMKLPPEERPPAPKRTLESFRHNLREFREKGKSDLKRAKEYCNVIHEPLLDIPISQVKGFRLLLLTECEELDIKIACNADTQAPDARVSSSSEFDKYVQQLREIKKLEKEAERLHQEAQQFQDFLTYQLSVLGLDENAPHLQMVVRQAQENMKNAEEKPWTWERSSKPWRNSFRTLQSSGNPTHPTHGACFVGNHVNIALKTENIEKICSVVVREAMAVKTKFHELFTFFGSVHFLYNSSTPMNTAQLRILENGIKEFAAFYQATFPDETFPPKFHMLEVHVVDFIREWKFPLAFLGEHGGESIHHELNQLNREFSSIHPVSRRQRKIIEEHSIRVAPLNRSKYPEKKNRKRRAHTATTRLSRVSLVS